MKKLLLFITLLGCYLSSFATHNRAGQITYKHISGLTYEFEVVIYADGTSSAFARKDIEIDWGDNLKRDSLYVNSENAIDPSDRTIIKRIWKGTHTFPGPGTYTVSVEDPNRNGGVDNISNSVGVPFYLETTIRISPIGNITNDSPQLLNDPIDEACVGQPFIHNPGAYDPNGDSLAYELASSKGVGGFEAPGFYFPANMTVDPINGDLKWNYPTQAGQINVAILIKEYRNGVLLGSILRDIQIDIKPVCDNQPPTIFSKQNYCIEAGKTLNELIYSTDPNSQDKVTLSASGAPFEVANSPAMFNAGSPSNPINSYFIWNTLCEHVQLKPYEFSVRAIDNGKDRGSINLSTYKSHYVQVIAPSPDSFKIQAAGNATAKLEWENGKCKDAIGYYLYRRIDSTGFIPDSCTTGVPEVLGYTKIADINDINTTTFIDDNEGNGLVPGIKYCYLIISYFEDKAESYASEEICIQLDKVVPLITKTSVVQTNETNGVMDLEWSPPNKIDSANFPAPYGYLIYHNHQLIDSTSSFWDTAYIHSGINTFNQQHNYKIELWSYGNNRIKVGESYPSNSLFLDLAPTDQAMNLSWNSITPWRKDSFIVYRKDPNANNFNAIDTVYDSHYTDKNLNNEEEYCYYIAEYGSYNLANIDLPLINLSQEACDSPVDNVPPCPISFTADSDCDKSFLELQWKKGEDECEEVLAKYQIFYSTSIDGVMKLLGEVKGNVFSYKPPNDKESGCYTIRGIDSVGNVGEFSTPICIDFCPYFKLPNIFTPNGDGINDFFEPIPPNNLPNTPKYRDIDSIDLKIYNRWGTLVYETNNPDIKWDGTHYKENELLGDGVYFYNCLVFEKSLEKDRKPRILKGNISILDSRVKGNRQTE